MRLHLVDGTYELFRAHFSGRPEHRDPSGQQVKATVGVVSSLIALLHDEDEAVTHIAVAFDNPIVSFRNDLFAGYKTDLGVLPELRAQFDGVEEAVRSLGIVVWSMKRYEADDALATAAARFCEQVDQVRILTPDKDLGQSLKGTRVVQVDRRKKMVVDEPGFRARYGFCPRSMPDFLALVGDPADNIPGLRGFGEKTASMLVARYEHIERIPSDFRQWNLPLRGAETLAATLAAHRADALLYRELATLIETVPLAESLGDLAFRGVPQQRFHAWCDAVGARTLKLAPRRWEQHPGG